MKRKLKSIVSVILSLMMVISMVTVAFFTINAAIVDDSSVGVGAVNGVIKKGDTLYYDFSAAKPNRVNLIGDNWKWIDTGDIPADYIFKYTLTADMDFNSPQNGTLCRCDTGSWTVLKPTVPSDGKNMVKVAADGKSYTWETFSGSETPTEPTTEPTTAPPSDPVAKWALNGNLSTDINVSGWNNNFSAAKLVGTYESSFATGEVFSVSLELDSEKYFRLIKKDDTSNQYRPVGSGNGVDHDLIKKGNNTQESACNTETGSDGAFYLSDGSYTLYVDQSGATPKVWCTSDSGLTDGEITLTDDTVVNGSLSFSAEGNTSGTADIGKNVTITAKPFAGFNCTTIKVTYTAADGTAVEQTLTASNNTASFEVPDVLPNKKGIKEISFEASFKLNKESYLSTKDAGLWIDVAPDNNDSTATLIKWNNYYGYNHDINKNPYTFYVPKNVELSTAMIYNGYSNNVTVASTTIAPGTFGKVSLSVSDNISVSGISDVSSIKVMQGSTNAMFLYTTKKGNETPLNTKTYADWNAPSNSVSKSDEKTDGGSCVTMLNDDRTVGEFSSAMNLESVKGRGNSSWEASAKRFGKYAYNMKLSEKTTLFDMAKDTKDSKGSKSWCLLANNADESMLRNALAYKLAADTGLYSSPEFSFVDIYDNGEYLGQYLVTEKVDVGESKLVYGKSIEDINEDAGLVFDEEPTTGRIEVKNASFTVDDNTYFYDYRYTRETTGAESPDISKATYLLEFEIGKRYLDEACWFTTPQGQHVVIKTPEFATEAQVKYIAEKFIAMEAKVFNDVNNTELSKYIDLDSFARMYLIQELSSNLDAASTSYYVTYDCSKGADARFVASPVWDYDWAFGQYEKTVKLNVNGNNLYPQKIDSWYAKDKSKDDSEDSNNLGYSIQSKLANNSSFQQVIKKVWDGTGSQEGFYAKVKKYYGNDSKIDQWYNKIKDSVNMNETRWGFILYNNLKVNGDWGSSNTGDTHSEAVNYLENTFLAPRANWLNEQFNNYTSYTQIANSTLTAYKADGETELTGEATVGDSIVLKAQTSEIFVTYELYKNDVMVESNDNGVFTVPAENGTTKYTVKTLYGTNDRMKSNDVTVTASGQTAQLTGVSLSAPTSAVTGASITLKATPVFEGNVTGITYSYYMSADNIEGDDTLIRANTTLTSYTTKAPDTAGKYYYYVKATFGETTKTSSLVPVEVTEQQGSHPVKVWFKSSSGNAYIPSVSLDGGSYQEMTSVKMGEENSTYIGSTLSGSLKFYWFYADITIDSTSTHTLTFRTAGTSVRATSEPDYFNGTEYHFAVDNLVQDTTLVNLTGKDPYIKNFHRSATHMVYSGIVPGESSLGFTFVDGVEYPMGKYVDKPAARSLQASVLAQQLGKFDVPSSSSVGARFAPFNIDSATLVQKFVASIEDISELQWCLLDVNLDGQVDIMDATLMQKALAQ